MNKLITTDTGGFPFKLDDLRQIASGVETSLKTAGNIIGNNFIVSGCVVTTTPITGGNEYTWTAGFMFIDNEFCVVPASTAPVTVMDVDGFAVWWEKLEVIDAAGDKVFESGSPYSTYKNYVGNLVSGSVSVPAGLVSIATMAALTNSIGAKMVLKIRDNEIEMKNNFGFSISYSAFGITAEALGGTFDFSDTANIQQVEFTPADPDLVYLDSDSSTKAGHFKIVRFYASGGATSFTLKHLIAGSAGTRFKIRTTDGKNRTFRNGDIAVFYNDNVYWNLISGGSELFDEWHIVKADGLFAAAGNGWDSTYPDLRFKKIGSTVHIDGLFHQPTYTTGSGSLMFTLPVGYRPTQYQFWNQTDSNDNVCYFEIDTNGKVYFNAVSSYSAVYLSSYINCSFLVD